MRMGFGVKRAVVASLLALAAAAMPHAAEAQSDGAVAQFYKGKTLTLVIGYSPGGGYDVFARVLAPHIGRHIPGQPGVVPQNMPGAGSRVAANFLFEAAPKDGTVFGTIGRNEAIAPLVEEGLRFDSRRFGWIGSITDDNSVCVAWHTSPIKTWAEMRKGPFTTGALAPGDNTVTVALALRNLLGANIKLVTGYPGTNEMFLALERGEVDGACGVSWRPLLTQRREWITQKKLNVLVQVALARDETLPDTPLVMDFVERDGDRDAIKLLISTQAMARPFLLPPGVPDARKQALRDAFDLTMKDENFLADIKKGSLYVAPMAGAAIDKLLAEVYASPAEVRGRATKAVQQ